jgi:hypothetical protein
VPVHVLTGDLQVAFANEIFRCQVGSGVHGIAIDGTDDTDMLAVFIEPSVYALGVLERQDGYGKLRTTVARTQEGNNRSGHDDVDLVLYSLRRYLQLACAGNPSVLLPLFVKGNDIIQSDYFGQWMQNLRPYVVSRKAGARFLGYLQRQKDGMLGKLSVDVHRPELVEKYGYDTKFASHAVRLGLQGIELLTTGELTLPMPEGDRRVVRAVKTGQVTKTEALAIVEDVERKLLKLYRSGESPLPDEPDLHRISTESATMHQTFWKFHELQPVRS